MTKQHFGKSHVPLSPGAGDYVFVSGQVPTGADGKVVEGGIEEQTGHNQVMENSRRRLGLPAAPFRTW